MSYLEQLLAVRTAMLDFLIANPTFGVAESYSLDGESYSVANFFDRLTVIEDLILREQNRVSGRVDLRVVRGRHRGGIGRWR